MTTPRRHRVLILDYGSQYTQLIARRIREERVYCEIHPPDRSLDWILEWDPKAIVLSGGPSSVRDDDGPVGDVRMLHAGIPILGICYGMQLIARLEGGSVRYGTREYGRARLEVKEVEALFNGFAAGEHTTVWCSHGDHVQEPPDGYRAIAATEHLAVAAFRAEDRPVYGVQFHPEVAHTRRGGAMLSNFLFRVAGCRPSWTASTFIDHAVARMRDDARGRTAICGLSGGVDSAVAAALAHRAFADRLTCIFVDNGLLREGEREGVERTFRSHMGMELIVADARREFLEALAGVVDPERKRRIIGERFIRVFERTAQKKVPGASLLVQGTLYPDVIESHSVRGPSHTIKTHHNVGGLPEDMPFELVEPLRELFKDEVRRVGRELDLPAAIVERHPFPGPGLAVRVLGPVSRRRVAAVRAADAIFLEEIRAAGLYNDIWQAFAVLLPVRSVGVMGDARTWENAVALRAVTSRDGMTADWYRFPPEVLARASTRIINEVEGVNRVAYDISSKPPATIEWE